MQTAATGKFPPDGGRDSALSRTLQPRIGRRGIDWLNRIMLAHGRDTWGEAAEIVLAAIVGDPADPVNAWAFTAADAPPVVRYACQGGKGNPFQFSLSCSVCVRLDPGLARQLVRLTGLDLTPSRAAAAVLAVARRLDPEGARYMPEARP